MTDTPNILCVGRLYCDIVFTDLPRMPSKGTEVFAQGVGLHAGGGAAICAGHFSALGCRSALAAERPPKGLGDPVIGELQRLGIGLSLCRTSDACADPQLTVALGHGGERAFVTNRTGPAFPKFTAEDVALLDIAHFHIGEATTLVENPDLVAIAHAIGATLSLDCSWDDELDVARLGQLLPDVDVFLPNEAEVGFLTARGVSSRAAKMTVIKRGADGATAMTPNGDIHAPAERARVVDSTGAGDAFNAGFLSAWFRNEPIETCLARGNAQGALAVRHRGGLGGLMVRADQAQLADASLPPLL